MKKYERFGDNASSAAPIEAEVTIQLPPSNGRQITNGGDSVGTPPEALNTAALSNAVSFLGESSEDLEPTFDIDGELELDNFEDPSQPPLPGLNSEYVIWKLRRTVQHLFFRLLTLVVIVADVCVIIIDLVSASEGRNTHFSNSLAWLSLIFSVYFVVEVGMRIVALGSHFFGKWFNFLDLAVIAVTFVLAIVDVVIISEVTRSIKFLVIVRLVRVVRLIRLVTEKQHLETGARQFISQNKRRYQKDGFDLDLTYVTDRIIAMSFPSSGHMSLYRNPISEVSRFFNNKHHGAYKIYNLCSERSYDESFFDGRVERFMIDDHNVPTVADMVRFVKDVEAWFSQNQRNVVAVHCKGGKGRTGTMICVWLIRAGMLKDAASSLHYFSERRTDLNVSTKFQGVETPSQCRFVGYFEKVNSAGLVLPRPAVLRVDSLIITGLAGVGKGNGLDFSVTIDEGRGRTVFAADFGTSFNCEAEYKGERDTLSVRFINSPAMSGEVRMLFKCSSKRVPTGYENVPFYFWFHTSFIESNRLYLTREELDNPHKAKTWKTFREKFAVEVVFTPPGS
ncbi:unnamed protein product [Notodromas monacha]|uniref:Phosphatidylinositol-3,4,5-trisphosphate 3-phosphatase n=1 Tax=Notodromas monacha TaxID=399045 RepID=A0A7R9BD55_9CRUS|nr:unnamed protein product [Notodromas monacha]CAG0913123.1 unnamed protein product [Notodromas monacha]